MRLNGRQTIYQMIQLADEVPRRGGTPLEPLAYKHRYHDLLMERIQGRLHDLESGRQRRKNGPCPAVMPCWRTCDARGLRFVPGQRHRLEIRPP